MPVSDKVFFQGHAGHQLAARLDRPDGPVRAVALLAHCFTCSKDIPAARRIAGALTARGVAVLRFDFTGLGHSEGEFANTNFSSNVQDLLCAARYLADQGMPAQLLIGHSLGGAAVIKAAPELETVRAVVTIGAPSDPSHVSHHFQADINQIHEQGSAEVLLAGRPFQISKQFLLDIEQASLKGALSRLGAALLVLHSPIDQTVDISNAAEIFGHAKHPKSFVTLDDADHLVSHESDAAYIAELIAAWSQRYLTPAISNRVEAPPEAPEGVVRVRSAAPGGFEQQVSIDTRHALTVDEPVSVGGRDAGPTPYQLLSASLGACTAMTIQMVARRRQWSLENVSVDVTHNKVHAATCESCTTTEPPVDVFERHIHLQGPLSDQQRQALLVIADKCPVHRTLHQSSTIHTHLAGET